MKRPMQSLAAAWQALLARPLREQLLLLAALLAALLWLGDRLLTGPAWAERQAAHQQLAQAERALAELRAQSDLQARERDALRVRQDAERDALRRQIEQLRAAAPVPLEGAHALALLETLVERQRGRVQWVALTALPDAAAGAGAAGAGAAGAGTALAAGPRLYRHGLKLVVQGRYADLHAYLNALAGERRLQVRGFQLAVLEHPQLELSLHIETVSPQAAWLTL